jgi:hypothetical protein
MNISNIMSKFNENISLWMCNENEQKTFYAFKCLPENKAIEGLITRILLPNKFVYPIARIYVKTELKLSFVQGIKIDNIDKQQHWYGADISAFKKKLILNDPENSKVGPFYSNSLIVDKIQQLTNFIEHYKSLYINKIASLLVYELFNGHEILVVQATCHKNKLQYKKLGYEK